MRQRPKRKAPKAVKRAARRPSKPLKKLVLKIHAARKKLRKILTTFPETPPSRQAQPAAPWSEPQDRRLPSAYGDDKLVLLVRDPWWLFAYWEITPARQEAVIRQIEEKRLSGRKTVLRVYDVTGTALPRSNSFFDIELNFYADNWYIDVGLPDRQWVAEVGYRVNGGRFFALVRSNAVRTPSFGLSDVLDEEWMLPEDIYYRIIGRSISTGTQEGSMDIRKMLEKYLRNVVSSERLQPPPAKTQVVGTGPASR